MPEDKRKDRARTMSLLREIRDEAADMIGSPVEALLPFGVFGLPFVAVPTCLALFVWAGEMPKVAPVALVSLVLSVLVLGGVIAGVIDTYFLSDGSRRERCVRALALCACHVFLVYLPGGVIGFAIFFGWREGVWRILAAWWQWLSGHFGAG